MGSKRLTAEGGPEEEEKSARGGPLVKDVAAIPVTRVRGIRFCFREMANRAVEFTPCDYFAARSWIPSLSSLESNFRLLPTAAFIDLYWNRLNQMAGINVPRGIFTCFSISVFKRFEMSPRSLRFPCSLRYANVSFLRLRATKKWKLIDSETSLFCTYSDWLWSIYEVYIGIIKLGRKRNTWEMTKALNIQSETVLEN